MNAIIRMPTTGVSPDVEPNPMIKPMNITLHQLKTQAAGAALITMFFALGLDVGRAQDTWTGAGQNANWLTPLNWQAGSTPLPGDSLVFTGVTGLNNTNNFPAATSFGGVTFATPAGAFILNGNSITLNGNLADQQPVTVETINLPLALGQTPVVDVATNGVLTINSVISGGSGVFKIDGGQLNLNAVNTFTGPLTIFGGTVAVAADSNLGTAPASAAPGSLVMNGGELLTTTSFTLNANRGIALGTTGVVRFGVLNVPTGLTLTYGGVIADNSGGGFTTGGLVKRSFGGLILFGANTYSGPTIVKNGSLKLDFTQATSPANNIINSVSALTVGGETAGVGLTNNATLLMGGKAGTVNSQAFSSTLIDVGGEVIQATNGAGGTANLTLGPLTHNSGGTVVIIPPASGSIITTSPNNNGILGGWATISGSAANQNGVLMGTNYATVDVSGNITNYNGYLNYSSGNLAGQVGPATNLLFSPTASAQVITVDSDNAGTTTDVNSFKIYNPFTFSGIYIGPGNTVRLGQYGGILAQEGAAAPVVTFGGVNNSVQSGNGASGSQDVGILTAGGAPNTPGEIDLTINNNNETSGSFIFESTITDNGTGPVTFVKAGPGPMKLDGHNTFSGGLYILQGRLQFAGSEIGTGNPGGGGTGPIYVYPGAEFFPSGTGTAPITNAIFLSGNGVSDAVGSIRLSGVFSNGVITLIGDSRLGGGGPGANITGNPVAVYDKISGPFNLDFGATGNSGGTAPYNNGALLYNQSNDWSGNTTIVGRAGAVGGTALKNGANDVIPDGFGKGNMQFGNSGNTTSVTAWDLNGFNETINGLITLSFAVPGNTLITNSVPGKTSTLTVGNNDQSGTFSGAIGGNLAFTKIGGGAETLTGSNTFFGPLTINGGTLALSGAGSINNSPIQVNSGGTLDISLLNGGFSTAQPVGLNGGIIIGNGATGNLNLTNAELSLDINTAGTNLVATALATGGATNLININSIAGVSAYPATFPIIKYSGAIGGAGNNFGLGAVPNANTVGYVSNDVANARILLVLLNGPKVLTWTGTSPVNPTFWDTGITTNWLAFKGTIAQAPSVFSQADSITFDDTGSSSTVNVMQSVTPGVAEVTNNSLNYTFTGVGGINGKLSMTKDGAGSLLLDNGGNSGIAISGVFAINKGTVQVGNNDTNGSISAAAGVVDNGTLVYNRSDNVTNSSSISGTGVVNQTNVSVLTLSGNNSFGGGANVLRGTLQAGSGTALGSTNGTTTVNSGATLDVGGQTLNNYPVVVSGTGVGGNGAIINSVADNTTAMGNVTLVNDTTFGGTRRWDIRGGAAQLSTLGNFYNLTKVGTNQISLVGVNVDGSLANINVQSGLFSAETTISGLGDPGSTLTIASGATFQVFGTVNILNKQFALNGNGLATTFNCASGFANNLAGPIALTGNCIFNATGGAAVTFSSGSISSAGSLTMTGTGTNIISSSATATITGGTIVSNGTLVVDGSLSGNVNITPAATLAGVGTISGTVTVTNGTVYPGDIAGTLQGALTVGPLTLSNSTVELQLGTASTNQVGNDKVVVNGALTLSGSGTNTLLIQPLSYMNVGDVFTNIQYAGALPSSITNQLKVVSSRAGFAFHVVDPGTTPGFIEIKVDSALGNDFWTGAASATWDTSSVNWTRNSGAVIFNNGDYVSFNDSSSVNNVTVSGALNVSGMTMLNSAKNYVFTGSGSLTNTGTLQLNGGGTVTIANTGTNNFQGATIISSGILQLGNGGAGGNLGTGIITNNGSLVFNRSDNALAVNNAVAGSGSLTNLGTGLVTLGGANTFDGNVTVAQGTLRVASSSALGDVFGVTLVNNGATLDITNSANVGKEPITASGAGVGGNGAIVNGSGNSTFVAPNFQNLTITTNITVGGSGRLDFRATSASAADAVLFCSPFGQPYTFTKSGTNLLQMAGLTLDPGLGDIVVQAGTLGFQWQIPYLGDPSHNLIVSNGASIAFFDMSNAVSKVLILNNGASVLGQHGGNNEFDGPVTLNGTNTFNVSGGAILKFGNKIGGLGSLVFTNSGELILATGPVTNAGNVYASSGTLALVDPVALTNNPGIILSSATLDVSGRADDTITLGAGGLNQTLAGGGIILGALVENLGSTVNPGNGVAPVVLTVTNGVKLNGAVVMNLNVAAGAVTNDEIVLQSNLNLTASGTLTVTNLGPNLSTGNTFKLFSVPVSGFTAVNLPSMNSSGTVVYTWQTNLATSGSITVASAISLVNTNPTNITVSVNGGNLTLSWPSNHIGWRLQAETNSLNVGLGTNWATVPGSTNVNTVVVPIVKTNGAVFYRLIYP
jgi:fibronectin-binding autotransporter adhesin